MIKESIETKMANFLGCQVGEIKSTLRTKYRNSYANLFDYEEYIRRNVIGMMYHSNGKEQNVLDPKLDIDAEDYVGKIMINVLVNKFLTRWQKLIVYLKSWINTPYSPIIIMTILNRIWVDKTWLLSLGWAAGAWAVLSLIFYIIIKISEKHSN